MDFDFMATSERSSSDDLHDFTCGVDGNWDVYSRIANIHQKSKKVTS